MPPSNSNDEISVTKAAKAAGFTSFNHFLLSYGLRIYEMDDVEEGKAILKGMGYNVS